MSDEHDLKVPWDSQWRQIAEIPNYWMNQYGQVINMKSMLLLKPFVDQGADHVWLFYRSTPTSKVTRHKRAIGPLFRVVWPDRQRKFVA